jgi:hypothetical protein
MQADPGEEHNLVTNPAFRKTADELKKKASLGWVEKPPRKAVNATASESGATVRKTKGKSSRKVEPQ